MKIIFVQDVTKMIDVRASDVDPRTVEFLNTYYRSYNDRSKPAENLCNIVSAAEPDAMSKSKSIVVRREIKLLAKLAEENDAAYVRFTVV